MVIKKVIKNIFGCKMCTFFFVWFIVLIQPINYKNNLFSLQWEKVPSTSDHAEFPSKLLKTEGK